MKKFKIISYIIVFVVVISLFSENSACTMAAESNSINPEGENTTLKINMDDGTTEEQNGFYFDEESGMGSVAVGVSMVNYLWISISPQKASYKITLFNLGADPISQVSLITKTYKYSGAYITSGSKVFKNLKPGFTNWTWKVPKGNTVQEKIIVSGVATDGNQTINFRSFTFRYNFEGGKFGSMKAFEGERHHMPSDSINGLSRNAGPCIRMIKADHKRTASNGNSNSAKEFRKKEKEKVDKGYFLAAQNLGIKDVKTLFGPKYDTAINQMIKYTKSLGYTK